MKKIALISVSNKEGITDFANKLKRLGYEILATGNTARLLESNKIRCTEVSDFTGFPEIFEGRVKTLHPKIFGGILMRRTNNKDLEEADRNSIAPIDIVCVNLYPFPDVVNKGFPLQEKLENIDIGGPSLIRAAAKNFEFVSVLTNPDQYDNFLEELEKGNISLETRKRLAYRAFEHTAFYDSVIADFLAKEFRVEKNYFRLNLPLQSELRYGENPHQKAFIYGDFESYFEKLHGKELSYNNIVDLNSAVELVHDLGRNACVIVKHTNPCGSAIGENTLDAYLKALSCDPVSAFGGIVAFYDSVNKDVAEKLNEMFLEIVAAPDFTDEAMEILKKKKNRRIVKIKTKRYGNEPLVKTIPGGLLVQEKDNSSVDEIKFKTVTRRQVTGKELEELKFAWAICKHTKSNAIVIVKDKKGIGIGAGQMSRVDSAKIAIAGAEERGHNLQGAVAASDAFFPFPDGVEVLAAKGITAIVQPGGSVRDNMVIEAADKLNVSMVFTGIRNFKH